ncbi:lasso peptide biosynthesis B2 protein [Bacillus carboniphilus]|uniref:Lasso peptide biosynthesis B2 protein n=1 Tax=Bacillus carboniphilus TaxID=86663 RepID=A0ABY9JTQ4_9BACI|nr:lasso peptide biosynthesis B2 protein [Bacillus carboniphilus]WLR42776.1 lasso peptide biosynthesis B2 protein [Bacillus carboniphilus]
MKRCFRLLSLFIFSKKEAKYLWFETICCLAYARVLKNIPFSRVVCKYEMKNQESSHNQDYDYRIVRQVSQSIHTISKYCFWETECLVKALAAMNMLKRRKIESTLYLGTGKEMSGKLIAHAWLRSGQYYVTGIEEKENFTVVKTLSYIVDAEKSRGDHKCSI